MQKYLICKHLAAQSLYHAQMYSEALSLLEIEFNWKESPAELALFGKNLSIPRPKNVNMFSNTLPEHVELKLLSMFQVCSSLYLLRGKIHEAMDNRIPAIGDFKMALKLDVYCIEAYELLVRHEMLTPEEGENTKYISDRSNCIFYYMNVEQDLLDLVPFEEQCTTFEGEAAVIKALYHDQIKKYCKPQERSPSIVLAQLRDNLSVKVNYAERCLYGCDYRECVTTLEE